MRKIFISYSSSNEVIAKTISIDIKGLGNTVWFDEDLAGGEAWWSKILDEIRKCDIFIFLLSSESSKSKACLLELEYSTKLGKTQIPVQISGDVKDGEIPTALRRLQILDHIKSDRAAAIRLAKAINLAQPSKPLPDPLPSPPEAPDPNSIIEEPVAESSTGPVTIVKGMATHSGVRLTIGLIVFSLPIVVSLITSVQLSSISGTYHTEARDFYVGLHLGLAVLLFFYKGHSQTEYIASKVGSISAVLMGTFPVACETCEPDIISIVHYGATVMLFSISAYFCFGPFRFKIKGQKGKRGLRSKIYFTCGTIMLGCLLIMGLAPFILYSEVIRAWRITYWGETIAYGAFGVAWIVAGKDLSFLVDRNERHRIIM